MAGYDRRVLLKRTAGAVTAGAGALFVGLGLRQGTTIPATEAKKRRAKKNPKKKGRNRGSAQGKGHKGHTTASADLILKNGLKLPAKEIAIERKPSGQRSGGETQVYLAHNLLPFQEFGSLAALGRAVEQGEELGLFKLPKA